jgi:hypothetical protein
VPWTRKVGIAVLRQALQPLNLRMYDAPHPEYVAGSPRVVAVIHIETEATIWLKPILISLINGPGPLAKSVKKSRKNGGALCACFWDSCQEHVQEM